MTHTPEDPFAQNPHGSAPRQPQSQPPQPPLAPEYGTTDGQPQYAQPQYAQPQYAQPGQQQYGQQQYGQPAYGPNPGAQKNWMGITSLVLSLASLITGFTAIGGIIFGHLSLAAVKRGEANNRGMGIAGLITGYVFLVLGILSVVALVAFFSYLGTECTGGDTPAWCSNTGTNTWEIEIN